MSRSHEGLSVVVPCYNSGRWLSDLVERIEEALAPDPRPLEILLVNDASPDGTTFDVIRDLSLRHPSVVGIDLQFNVGQFRALLAGLEAARGAVVVTLDDDLQHPPEEIPVLLERLDVDPRLDVVVGRYTQRQQAWLRRVGRRLVTSLAQRMYGSPDGFESTSFRAMRRPLVDALVAHRTMRPLIGPLVLKSTRRVANVDVRHDPRPHGTSGYSLAGLVGRTVDDIVDSSTLPLRAFAMFGMLVSLGAVVLGVFYALRAVTGGIGLPGFATLVLLVLFFGGLTMLGIGLLGEYLVRVVAEVQRAPRYVIREESGRD